MKGTNHVVINISTLSTISAVIYAGAYHYHGILEHGIRNVCQLCMDFMTDVGSMPFWAAAVLIVLFVWVGALLPDIDTKSSLLGRMMHLPVEHRTWTHAVYFPIIFLVLGMFYRFMFWLGISYMLHLIIDSLSPMGVCFFYPFSRYKAYPGGAKVKHGHHAKLYRSGESSETVLTVFIVVICAGIIGYLVATGSFFMVSGSAK